MAVGPLPRRAVLTPAPIPAVPPNTYDAWLGPLRFVTIFDDVAETLGEGLEAVGAALTAAERRPRGVTLSLPVRGDLSEADPYKAGLRLRRQVRQLMENTAWRSQGLFFWFGADPELQGWMLVGGGELTGNGEGSGITFADFKLQLTDCYLVGRPGQVRPARRLELRDLRLSTAARDTRGTVYNTDFAAQALPANPAVLGGDTQRLTGHARRPLDTPSVAGPTVTGRKLWRTAPMMHGESVHYVPSVGELRDLDPPGELRVWDVTSGIPAVGSYTADAVADSATAYGWERVLGQPLDPSRLLAVDNGWARVLPEASGRQLRLERLASPTGAYRVFAKVALNEPIVDTAVLYHTGERAVVAYRTAQREYRVILQRGWSGPRLESYYDNAAVAGAASLLIIPALAYTTPAQTPSWVKRLALSDGGSIFVVPSKASTTATAEPVDGEDATRFAAPTAAAASAVITQIGLEVSGGVLSASDVASLSLADVRTIPTLVAVDG